MMTVRLIFVLVMPMLLAGCLSANIAKFEADLEASAVTHTSIADLQYEEIALEERQKYRIASPLPVVETAAGKAFAVPLHIPDSAEGLYFRCVLSTASALTAHIVYPTFIFLDDDKAELARVEPPLTARNDMSFDAAYFDGLVPIPGNASNVVAIFSPEHFGKKFRYEATIFVGTYTSGMMIGGDSSIDEGIPIGPGGPFRLEFVVSLEDESD